MLANDLKSLKLLGIAIFEIVVGALFAFYVIFIRILKIIICVSSEFVLILIYYIHPIYTAHLIIF